MSISIAIQAFLSQFQKYKIIIGYSGGVDSHVLLHALKNTGYPSVTAVHVNHQLNPKADAWALHCQSVCDALSLPIDIKKIVVKREPGDSLEEKAREARYALLRKYIDKNCVLVTAHHLEDQAETFLFQALRGAGTTGLSAMPYQRKLGEGWLVRPFLSISRDDIQAYAKTYRLQWIEDDSNINLIFSRNFLRNNIFPLLKQRFPKCAQNLARSARLIAEQEKIITEEVRKDFPLVSQQVNDQVYLGIAMDRLKHFTEPKQRLILREWFRTLQLRMPNEKHLKQILKDVVYAAPDAHPKFQWSGVTLYRERNFLYIANHDNP